MYYDNGRKGQYEPEAERWAAAPDIGSAVEVIAGAGFALLVMLALRWLLF